MSLESDLQTISTSIENIIKQTISNKGLVDTGTLLNSIKASITIDTSGEMQIKIVGEDYFKYLDDEHNIVNDAFSSQSFAQIEEEISNAYLKYLTEKIEE